MEAIMLATAASLIGAAYGYFEQMYILLIVSIPMIFVMAASLVTYGETSAFGRLFKPKKIGEDALIELRDTEFGYDDKTEDSK